MADGIGRRIRDAREAKGISQTVLARRLQISRQAMSKIELGQQGLEAERLAELIVILELSTEEVLQLLGLRVGQKTVIERVQDSDRRRCPGGKPTPRKSLSPSSYPSMV